MLTAIRSLFNESLAQSGMVSELDQIEYGQSKIVLEVAGYCYLAAVVDGVPTQDFINAMRRVLSRIVEEADVAIRHYSGDASAIPPTVNEEIRSLLTLPPASTEKKPAKPYPLFVAVGVLLLLILVPLGVRLYRDTQDRDLQVRASAALTNAFPGDQITVAVERDRLELRGIVVNPYIRSQAELLVKGLVPDATIQNALTLGEQPPLAALAEAHVRATTSVLNGIDGISFTSKLNKGDLLLRGTVEDAYSLAQVQRAFARIPGISAISNMIEVKQPAIENRIYFDVGSSALRPSERAKILLLKQWLDRHPPVHLRILGHNDQTGPDAVNRRLAQNRATTIRDILVTMGITAERLIASGRSEQVPGVQPYQGTWAHRCVRFEIIEDPGESKK
jgi:outer membrane protein OmpA-like peptidoglycan-associated protein